MFKLKENELFKAVNGKFPEIGKRIFRLWGKPGLVAYINDVIDDEREDPTPGLTAEIESALQGLLKEHDQLYPRQPGQLERHVLTYDEHFLKVNGQHRHIARQLKKLWGGPEFAGFVNNLLQETRDGTRQGFPPDVATALFNLLQKHDRDFPEHALKVGDIWTDGKAL